MGASDPSDQHPASVEIQTSIISWLAAMPATPGFTANVSTPRVRTQRTISSFFDAADVPVRRCKVCKKNVQLTQAGLVRVHKVNGSKCRNHGTSEYDVVSSVNEPQCIKLLRAFCSDRLDCLKRVPKASRNNLARAFITVFDKICSQPDLLSHWCSLSTIIGKCLSVTKKANNNSQSLASKVNERIRAFESGEEAPATRDQKKARKPKPSTQSPSEELSKRVSVKIEASDIKGAIRVASSDEEMVDPGDPAVVDELRK